MMKAKESSAVMAARWEMWNLRALFPEAEAADLAALREKRWRFRAFEEAALDRLACDGATLLGPGRRFLSEHPELAEGIVVTMHIGPYQFLPEPFLHAGTQPAVLLNEVAYRRFAVPAEAVRRRLGLPGTIDWIPVAETGFVRRMVAALRARRPVLVFLDGNGGLGGSARTLKHGMPYHLPGREIRVRTGLGRLVRRLGCPVHPVVVRWDEEGGIVWRKDETRRWGREADPEAVTRQLFDWGRSGRC
jgi:lauroyl/myristoyl acyltransferase